MRFLLPLVIAFSPLLSKAEPIITDTKMVESLNNKLHKNEYFLKKGPAKFKIYYFEIGAPKTPFYTQGPVVKRFYQKDNNCFELTVSETANIAKKVKCFNKVKSLYLSGFEEFKVVGIKDLISEGLSGFQTETFSKIYDIEAFLQPEDMFVGPRRKFKAYLSGGTQITLKKDTLQLDKNINLKVEKIGILPEKSIRLNAKIKPGAYGLVFSNSQGQVLIFNPPFTVLKELELSLNPKVPELLASMEKQSQTSPACLRDGLYRTSNIDCHKIIFETNTLGTYKLFKVLKLDFVKQTVNYLE